jgi:hypothetical protein
MLNINEPSTLEGSLDATALTMTALLEGIGNSLVDEHDWKSLSKQTYFVSTGAESYTIATALGLADFRNIIISNIYDRTNNQIIKPQSAERYQEDKSLVGSSAFYRYRLLGNSIYFNPAIPTGSNLYFEYKTKNWLEYNDGINPVSYKYLITRNTDTPLLDDMLLIFGLVWKYRDAKGFTFDEHYRTYERRLEQLKNADKDLGIVDFGKRIYIDYPNFPNTSY